MKKLQLIMVMMLLAALVVGCSDDKESPTAPTTPTGSSTTVWDATAMVWRSSVDATSFTEFMPFSFASKDTVSGGIPKPAAAVWDMAFRRDQVVLNGGISTTNSGDVEGVNLGVVDYSTVAAADTAGATWIQDAVKNQIDNWYIYDFVLHQIVGYSRNVYTLKDATGEHYIKFQIDSLIGAGQPPSMGTVYIKYYYQPAAGNDDLSGTPIETSFLAGTSPVYFDFSSGGLVTPADPTNSLEWDISFFSYEIAQNNGPNGIGTGGAFPAYDELTDATDLSEVISGEFSGNPSILTPYFQDYIASAFDNWYTYNGVTHTLSSNGNTYLVRTGGKVYKMKIENWYKNISGVATSGHYTYVWNEL